ncbi:O-antigen ligase family protein [Salinibacter ruber]|uniref:O-antigen ligase family protein n=1 Tax=Salinibacter ruber TaxID=146919 RepID=UPI000E581A97|nr:O-antigen ligase family protein [Salinibacter ruber]
MRRLGVKVIYAIVLTIPLTQYNVSGKLGLSIPDILILLFTLLAGLSTIGSRKGKYIAIKQVDKINLFLVFTYLVFLSIAIINTGERVNVLVTTLGNILLFLGVSLFVDEWKILRNVIIAYIVGSVLLSLIAILQAVPIIDVFNNLGHSGNPRGFGGQSLYFKRSLGTYKGPGVFYMYILPPFVMSFVFITEKNLKKTIRGISIVAFLLILMSVVVGQTRAGWLGAFVGIYAVILLKYNTAKRLLVLTGSAALAVVLIMSGTLNRLWETIVYMNKAAYVARLQQFTYGVRDILNNPVVGIGFGQFVEMNKDRLPMGYSMHNVFLKIAITMGVPAMLAFIALCWNNVKSAISKLYIECSDYRRNIIVGIVAGGMALLIQANFVGAFNQKPLWLILGILGSVGNVKRRRDVKYR